MRAARPKGVSCTPLGLQRDELISTLTQRYATLTLDSIAGARVAPRRDFNFSRINLAIALMLPDGRKRGHFRAQQGFVNGAAMHERTSHRAFASRMP
jgi:hypothetical protein